MSPPCYTPTPAERIMFDALWQQAMDPATCTVQGAKAVQFLSTSGLPKPTLRAVWAAADHQQAHQLALPEFYIALRLIAVLQAGLVTLPEKVDVNTIEKTKHAHVQLPEPWAAQLGMSGSSVPSAQESNALISQDHDSTKDEDPFAALSSSPDETERVVENISTEEISNITEAVAESSRRGRPVAVADPSSLQAPLFSKKDRVRHTKANGLVRVGEIAGVHLDDIANGIYYTIRLEDGHEFQTDERRLVLADADEKYMASAQQQGESEQQQQQQQQLHAVVHDIESVHAPAPVPPPPPQQQQHLVERETENVDVPPPIPLPQQQQQQPVLSVETQSTNSPNNNTPISPAAPPTPASGALWDTWEISPEQSMQYQTVCVSVVSCISTPKGPSWEVKGAAGAELLRHSGLAPEQLRAIWNLVANPSNKAVLSVPAFIVAFHLAVGVSKKGMTLPSPGQLPSVLRTFIDQQEGYMQWVKKPTAPSTSVRAAGTDAQIDSVPSEPVYDSHSISPGQAQMDPISIDKTVQGADEQQQDQPISHEPTTDIARVDSMQQLNDDHDDPFAVLGESTSTLMPPPVIGFPQPTITVDPITAYAGAPTGATPINTSQHEDDIADNESESESDWGGFEGGTTNEQEPESFAHPTSETINVISTTDMNITRSNAGDRLAEGQGSDEEEEEDWNAFTSAPTPTVDVSLVATDNESVPFSTATEGEADIPTGTETNYMASADATNKSNVWDAFNDILTASTDSNDAVTQRTHLPIEQSAGIEGGEEVVPVAEEDADAWGSFTDTPLQDIGTDTAELVQENESAPFAAVCLPPSTRQLEQSPVSEPNTTHIEQNAQNGAADLAQAEAGIAAADTDTDARAGGTTLSVSIQTPWTVLLHRLLNTGRAMDALDCFKAIQDRVQQRVFTDDDSTWLIRKQRLVDVLNESSSDDDKTNGNTETLASMCTLVEAVELKLDCHHANADSSILPSVLFALGFKPDEHIQTLASLSVVSTRPENVLATDTDFELKLNELSQQLRAALVCYRTALHVVEDAKHYPLMWKQMLDCILLECRRAECLMEALIAHPDMTDDADVGFDISETAGWDAAGNDISDTTSSSETREDPKSNVLASKSLSAYNDGVLALLRTGTLIHTASRSSLTVAAIDEKLETFTQIRARLDVLQQNLGLTQSEHFEIDLASVAGLNLMNEDGQGDVERCRLTLLPLSLARELGMNTNAFNGHVFLAPVLNLWLNRVSSSLPSSVL